MAKKYIPYFPETIEGQAILDNFLRSRRMLRYRDNDKVTERIERGMPLYEMETVESVTSDGNSDNLLIRGECLSACSYLKDNNKTVDLVYIDPPFASGTDYAKKVYIRKNPHLAEKIKKVEEELDNMDELRGFEEKMYGDFWTKEAYLNWMYENLMAIKSVMSENASIYVHLSWHIGHYVKVLLDEVFGEANFRNEIVWHYYNKMQGNINRFASNHDVIFLYSKSEDYTYNKVGEAREETTKQIKRVWDKSSQKLVNAKDENGRVIYEESNEKTVDDVWRIPMLQPAGKKEAMEYSTQKPEKLLERVIRASSDENMVVADFFGGSGVASVVANRLGREFIHVDVGVNSIQTARDKLVSSNAEFDILEIKDGVSLYRNPAQTMSKLKSLIPGLLDNKDIGDFWEGSFYDSKIGTVPVYIPNLMDSTTRILDKPIINKIINEAIPSELSNGIKKVVVYYIDVEDLSIIKKFISDYNIFDVEIELRDLKEVLDHVVTDDYVEYELTTVQEDLFSQYCIEFKRFVSDRLINKINEYNEKRILESKKGFEPITISDNGLELIEYISLDCTNESGVWNSDQEIKIDKYGIVIKNGVTTHEYWDGKIRSENSPKRIKVRNISGDEIIKKVEIG